MSFKKVYFSVLLLLPLSTFAQQNNTGNRFSTWFVQDPISIGRNINSNTISNVGMITVALAGISSFDEPSSSYFQKNYSNSKALNWSNNFGEIKYAIPFSAALFGTSLLSSDKKFQNAAFTSFQSVLYTASTVNISKFVFARSRPYQNDGAYDFDFFNSGETSFPSGHSSTAFALFTPWAMYYPNVLTYSLMVIPAGTALARIAKGKHWASDVTAGALIGTYWGIFLSKKHLQKVPNNYEITPFISGNGGGISVNIAL
tara:strand:+ start:89951 stop:90724 length:774 start_codon:yes stop_codon:yes gene_type:complete